MTNCKEFRLNNAIVCPYNIFMVLCSKLKIFARCLKTSLTVTVKQREKLKRSLGVNQWKRKLKSPRLGGLCTTCYQTSTGLGRLDLRRSLLSGPRPFPRRERGSTDVCQHFDKGFFELFYCFYNFSFSSKSTLSHKPLKWRGVYKGNMAIMSHSNFWIHFFEFLNRERFLIDTITLDSTC